MRTSIQAKRLAGLAGAIGLVAVAGGCGGGTKSPTDIFGTPAGLTTIPSGTTSNISSDLNFEPGDEWFYAVNGYDNVASGSHIRHIVQGRLDRTASAGSNQFTGDTTLSDNQSLLFDDNTETATNISLYLIHNGSELDLVDDNMGAGQNTQTTVTGEIEGLNNCEQASPPSVLPLTWNTSTSLSGNSNMYEVTGLVSNPQPGQCPVQQVLTNIEVFNTTALDQENVTVPAGTFQTFKTSQTLSFWTQGLNYNITAWWAPQIGGFVKAQYNITDTLTNTTSVYTYQLLGFKNSAPG